MLTSLIRLSAQSDEEEEEGVSKIKTTTIIIKGSSFAVMLRRQYSQIIKHVIF